MRGRSTRVMGQVLVVTLVSVGSVAAQGNSNGPGNGNGNGPPGGGPPGQGPPAAVTVAVDCDAGESLADALETPAVELTVEFTGVCDEDLLIERNDVTLRSDGSGVITGAQDPGNPVEAIRLNGAHRIRFEDFTVDGSADIGIWASQGSEIEMVGVSATGSGSYGLLVDESSGANVADGSFNGNGLVLPREGIGAWGGARVSLAGTIELNDNARVGLIASDGATVNYWTRRPATPQAPLFLEASNNGVCGFYAQNASSVELNTNNAGFGGPLVVANNGFCGLATYGSASVGMGPVDVSGSSYGVLNEEGSIVSLYGTGGVISGNITGIFTGNHSTLRATDLSVSGNTFFGIQVFGGSHAALIRVAVEENDGPAPGDFSAGIWMEGSGLDLRSSTVVDNGEPGGSGNLDVFLNFGSRGDFQFGAGNIIGEIHCDGTEVIRGASCGPQGPALRWGGGPSSALGASGAGAPLGRNATALAAPGSGGPLPK